MRDGSQHAEMHNTPVIYRLQQRDTNVVVVTAASVGEASLQRLLGTISAVRAADGSATRGGAAFGPAEIAASAMNGPCGEARRRASCDGRGGLSRCGQRPASDRRHRQTNFDAPARIFDAPDAFLTQRHAFLTLIKPSLSLRCAFLSLQCAVLSLQCAVLSLQCAVLTLRSQLLFRRGGRPPTPVAA